MFDNLSDKLESAFKKLRGRGKLTEKNIKDGLREVKLALLEADVHYGIVKTFIESVKERAMGQEVAKSLTPGQQIVKIVNDEMTGLMGSNHSDIDLSGTAPASVMLVGLQGSGKTTTAAKLAVYLKKSGKKPYLVPADVYRPAAIQQLKKLAVQTATPVFASNPDMKPAEICRKAKLEALEQGCSVLLIDTAGRLHIDSELMDELVNIKKEIKPSDILLVADSMTGQDAVNIAGNFDKALDIGGIVLTKLDGDARGGAALSIKAVCGKPVKFVGVGEKLSDIEPFYPDRIASRILGMGDMLSFIEKAKSSVDEKRAKELEKKLRKNEFTLEDFREQMVQIRKMGSISEIIKMLPGMGKIKKIKELDVDEKEMGKVEAIINSMTSEERCRYNIINGSRRKRIAKGSGTAVQDVNRLLKNYSQILKMIKRVNKSGMRGLGALPF